ncbi:ankyrin repeat domain-containing protein [Actinomadura sp. HBU206391]|uniref:ankyrin repeat domain-containing protein n=1 Tax=Actinomadura sp. HBU206391 TaxID=2731692 RepID=UPI00164FF22E|nr:ankyrin repeat domain-containing protein [Actinomadura sp. HBU206391]MBC6462929.1 ankyrin repeat domain-containing protein [Actinomadura sp. HBU206391]
MSGASSLSAGPFSPDDASSWRRVRRYAVPRWMIDLATERRLAGDWRAACAAANVDVGFDLAAIARDHGQDVATAVEDDLGHLAPDLLRWHLPRILHGRTTLATHRTVFLARYGEEPRRRLLRAGDRAPARGMSGPSLHLLMPTMVDGPQRLTLLFGQPRSSQESDRFGERQDSWVDARHLWDVRRADELRERCGGGARAPFFGADGAPLGEDDLPATDPGQADPAMHTEWVSGLHERGEVAAALAAAGIAMDETESVRRPYYRTAVPPLDLLGRLPLALTRLAPEIERLSGASGDERFVIPIEWRMAVVLHAGCGGLRARVMDPGDLKKTQELPEALWRRLPDLDLLRADLIGPDELHPLIRSALFPERPVTGRPIGPPDPEPPSPVRVRCRGEWHEVGSHDGRLHLPHSDEEQQRERAMRAFGGAIAGCFAVQQAWASGTGRLPRLLRRQRQELFAHVQHGDTPAVVRLLDAGVDPQVRDGRRRTLLHHLHMLDHEALLPRLLAAGLDLEAREHNNRTPLHVAVGDQGSKELVLALLDAGARIDVVDTMGWSLRGLIRRHRRRELAFLAERVAGITLEAEEIDFVDYSEDEDGDQPW